MKLEWENFTAVDRSWPWGCGYPFLQQQELFDLSFRIEEITFEMLQIFRIVKPEMIQICRFYGSHRNLHSHYETLRLAPNASQKDIRQAFINLSKEMHPDLSRKTSHADFVKVNAAYKILSKEDTRKRYDMELNNGRSNGYPIRVVHYDPTIKVWYTRPTVHPHDSDKNGYGSKGTKRVSKVTIVLLCLVLSAISLVALFLAVNKSIVNRRDMLLAESDKYAEDYRKVHMEAESKDHKQLIADFEQRLATSDADTAVGLRS